MMAGSNTLFSFIRGQNLSHLLPTKRDMKASYFRVHRVLKWRKDQAGIWIMVIMSPSRGGEVVVQEQPSRSQQEEEEEEEVRGAKYDWCGCCCCGDDE